jgi:hypothetical protein
MVSKSIPVLLIFLVLVTLSGKAQQAVSPAPGVRGQVVPLKPFPREQRFETVSGDFTKPGALYVIRIHSEAGYIVMPHTHPEDEHITVVKGSWALGMGDRFNPGGLEMMEVGGYGLVARHMAHFARSKTDAIVQVHGIGPFTTTWVTPAYELTDQGVLLSTSATVPGRTVPAGCFDFKLGAHARAALGEGTVVRAQCTPGQLTQYRIEKTDGERFWAVKAELTTP